MKTIVKKEATALMLILLVVFVCCMISCSPRHSRCMSYHYDDVRRGLAH